ncbi:MULTISPECIES: HAD family hydrolase [Halorussus]|uniref:HAD family hydrolase n=1 Tax=Halorussus TaxID=1070314 RepID=UPI000E210B38|nr:MULTISPECIES: HAD family hydrolase [Halorussus]NHN58125.1 HAD family hydrolase [Halorussus sp. JP-T4]
MTDADVAAVFLDLDDTICTHPGSTADRLADAFEAAGVDPFFDVADFRRWLPEVTADSAVELRERCFTGIADERGRSCDDALAVARAYEDPDPTDVEFLPGAESALDALGASHDLALVTNGDRETQTAKLAALDIADRFDAATFTEPGGPVKPDPDHFRRTLSAMDLAADRAVHVGNSLRSDVAGAHAAGLTSVWLEQADATAEFSPHYTIASMHDLRDPPWV